MKSKLEELKEAYANLQLLICIFALSALAAGVVAAVDVQFIFGDFTAAPQGLKRFTLYPVVLDSSNNVQLVTRDRISVLTDSNGVVTLTNLQCGMYRSELFGTSITTTNLFRFPLTNGLVSAKDYQVQGAGYLLFEEGGVVVGKLLFEP